jgi:hypothetical protein
MLYKVKKEEESKKFSSSIALTHTKLEKNAVLSFLQLHMDAFWFIGTQFILTFAKMKMKTQEFKNKCYLSFVY